MYFPRNLRNIRKNVRSDTEVGTKWLSRSLKIVKGKFWLGSGSVTFQPLYSGTLGDSVMCVRRDTATEGIA